jgi:hypothetical protein
MMEKRKIEILEVGGIKEGIITREFGDICTIDKALADAYVDAGLAKCAETEEVGVRVAGAGVKVNINSIVTEVTQG